MKKRFSPQISGVMVSHHKMVSPQMVSPQNGDTRGGPPPHLSSATAYRNLRASCFSFLGTINAKLK